MVLVSNALLAELRGNDNYLKEREGTTTQELYTFKSSSASKLTGESDLLFAFDGNLATTFTFGNGAKYIPRFLSSDIVTPCPSTLYSGPEVTIIKKKFFTKRLYFDFWRVDRSSLDGARETSGAKDFNFGFRLVQVPFYHSRSRFITSDPGKLYVRQF